MGYAMNTVRHMSLVYSETVFGLFLVVCIPLQQSPSILTDGVEQVSPDGIPTLGVGW